MMTRSKTTEAKDAADRDMSPPPPSANSSRPRSNISGKSNKTSIRSQRILEAQLEAAQRLADIETNLVKKQLSIKMKMFAKSDDDIQTVQQLSPRPSETKESHERSNHDNNNPDPEHFKNNQFQNCATSKSQKPDVSKFLARQACDKELPLFSGAPEDWLLFYSQFKTTTRLCGFSEGENIARLQRCLRGEAREAVYALLLSSCNVDKIIDTLKIRFGRPEYIIDILINKLRNIRFIRHDDMSQLLKYATDIQNLVAIMISTEQRNHLYNPVLIKDVLSKLPSTLKIQWGIDRARRGLSDAELDLEYVSEWLMDIAKSTAEFTTPTSKTLPSKFVPVRTDRTIKPGLSVLTVKPDECIFCQQTHKLENCTTFLKLAIDDKWKYVTEAKLCFACLSPRHQVKACRRRTKCKEVGCNRVHHTVLHAEPRRSETNDVVLNTTNDEYRCVILKVVRVVISGDNGDVETSALLDEGAAVSLIDASLASRAGISGPVLPLRMCGAQGMTSVDSTSQCLNFNIRGHSCVEIFKLYNVRTVNNLKLPVNSFRYRHIVNKFPFLTDYIDVSDMTHEKIGLLIGQDNIDLIVTRQLISGPNKNCPYISITKLGNVVHGTFGMSIPREVSILHVCSCDQLNETLKRYYSTDDFDTKLHIDTARSREDLKALEILKTTTRQVGNRYETGLLWKIFSNELPDSYNEAHKRLQSIQKKMRRLPDFAEKYEEKIKDYLQKGYATKLTPSQAQVRNKHTWFLPHFAVFNPNKPNKLRFVLDAAAKSHGKSLNDFLLTGPDFFNSLPGILLNFRYHKYAIMGDIQEMFHQVLIINEDRCAQRFLWGSDEYQMNVMIFGAVCSPSSAQYVKNINAERFKSSHPRAVKAITARHYMDDFIDSVPTESEAIQLVDDVIHIHAQGGFNMTSFLSNSMTVPRHLPPDKLSAIGVKILNDTSEPVERVLGTRWSPKEDLFLFDLKVCDLSVNNVPTKREVLKLMMSVFDPSGFLLLVVMTVRMLLQDIWKVKSGWDDKIDRVLHVRLQSWLDRLRSAAQERIPRWLFCNEVDMSQPIQLHIFSDASARSFASVSYIRSIRHDGFFHVSFVMARGRIAPLKTMSIPRLELQAAVLGSRLAQTLKQHVNFQIEKVVYWSDSKTVLSWINSDSGRFKSFVAHRISEISEVTNPSDWRWVPSHLNPADAATRENDKDDFRRWFNGPEFLKYQESEWPNDNNRSIEISADDPETKIILAIDIHHNALPDDRRFSKYWRLIRATAWCSRFTFNSRHRNDKRNGELSANELEAALKLWIKESQHRSFAKDIAALKVLGHVDRSSRIFQLAPFLDNDFILRVKSRIDASDISFDTRNPIILDPSDRFVTLLILQYHNDAHHTGKEAVLNNLRQRFWILRGRSAVKNSWRICQICRILRAKPQPPLMGQIPPSRLNPQNYHVFSITGLDYFGPMMVKIGRRQEKRYGALFTCLIVRALHIELVADLTTDSAILALRRFIARRGTPKEIWSDNATTFKGADRALKEAIQQIDMDRLQQFSSIRDIEWKFICPNAPHHGGCWERLVRSVKVALRATLKERVPSEQTLMTILAEAEYMINNRPLTHVPIDSNDVPPLTPNNFLLIGRDDVFAPFGDFNDRDLIKRSWRESQRLSDLLWKRWVKEYLPTLTRRDKWRSTTETLKIDDIVIICDDTAPRNQWLKGIVTNTYPGKDGQVRIVDVKTATGTYKRPVTKLCRLDVQHSDQ